MLKSLFLWRKKWSARRKLKQSHDSIRELWESTRTDNSKSFDEVLQDFHRLIDSGKAFPIRMTIFHYFQFRLQYKGAQIEDYIFTSEWAETVTPIREWAKDDCAILNNKLLTAKHLSANGIPVAQQYGLVTEDLEDILVQRENGQKIKLTDLLKEKLQLFTKPHDGIQGKGAYLLSYVDSAYCKVNDEKVSYAELKNILKPGYLVEDVIRNHPDIDAIYPHSLNTMRILTMRDLEGKLHYVSGFHRFGVGGAKVDNAHSGGVAVGLNADKGTWKKFAYADDCITCRTTHPDSGFVFEDKTIPFFEESVKLALKAHSTFERVQAVGWDVAITPNGPMITEGNHNYWHQGNQYVDKSIRHEFDTMIRPRMEAIVSGKML